MRSCILITIVRSDKCLAEVCVCVLWWVLQTGAGEGVEKVEGPSPRGEGGEGERGPQSWTQEEDLSVAV